MEIKPAAMAEMEEFRKRSLSLPSILEFGSLNSTLYVSGSELDCEKRAYPSLNMQIFSPPPIANVAIRRKSSQTSVYTPNVHTIYEETLLEY